MFTPQELDLLRSIDDHLGQIASNSRSLPDATELQGTVMRLEAMVKSHEFRLAKAESDVENTGEIYVDDLKEKLRTYQGAQTHWVRYAVAILVSFIGVAVSTVIGYFLHQ